MVRNVCGNNTFDHIGRQAARVRATHMASSKLQIDQTFDFDKKYDINKRLYNNMWTV